MASKTKGKGRSRTAAKPQRRIGYTVLVSILIVLVLAIVGIGIFIGVRNLPKKEKKHVFENGVCTVCGLKCEHEFEEGSHECKICDIVTPHEYAEKSHKCTVCGQVSAHEFKDGVCTVCGEPCVHNYENGVCTVCGMKCEHDIAEGTHECKICGWTSEHTYDETTHKCTVCGHYVDHVYEKGSHVCAICSAVSAHEYEKAGSHLCTICGETTEHEWTDGVCMICGQVCTHEYAEKSHECTICGQMSAHEWANGVCTICEIACEHEYNERGFCVTCGTECEHTFESGICTSCGVSSTVYMITLNGNHGAFDDEETVKTIQIRSGLTLLGEPELLKLIPVREGYYFKGWFTDSKATAAYAIYESTTATSNRTLYAGWSVQYYSVVFESNGAGELPGQTIRHGNRIINTPSVTKDGYIFCGWFTREEAPAGTVVENWHDNYVEVIDGVTYLYSIFDFSTQIFSNMTFYARWADPNANEHHYENGVCVVCGTACTHHYAEGSHVCTICGTTGEHEYAEGSHVCTICGIVSDHTYADGTCTVCGECETHSYTDGLCSVCGNREIVYSGFSGINDFIEAYPNLFVQSVKAGDVLHYEIKDGLTFTNKDGVVYSLAISAFTVTRFNTESGSDEPLDLDESEYGWSFTVPDSGTITVIITAEVTRTLPEGYHAVTYTVQSDGMSAGSEWQITGVDYAEEGQVVMVRIDWNGTSEGGMTMPTINSANVDASSAGVTDAYTIVDAGGFIVVFFTVTGEANVVITIF